MNQRKTAWGEISGAFTNLGEIHISHNGALTGHYKELIDILTALKGGRPIEVSFSESHWVLRYNPKVSPKARNRDAAVADARRRMTDTLLDAIAAKAGRAVNVSRRKAVKAGARSSGYVNTPVTVR